MSVCGFRVQGLEFRVQGLGFGGWHDLDHLDEGPGNVINEVIMKAQSLIKSLMKAKSLMKKKRVIQETLTILTKARAKSLMKRTLSAS